MCYSRKTETLSEVKNIQYIWHGTIEETRQSDMQDRAEFCVQNMDTSMTVPKMPSSVQSDSGTESVNHWCDMTEQSMC